MHKKREVYCSQKVFEKRFDCKHSVNSGEIVTKNQIFTVVLYREIKCVSEKVNTEGGVNLHGYISPPYRKRAI